MNTCVLFANQKIKKTKKKDYIHIHTNTHTYTNIYIQLYIQQASLHTFYERDLYRLHEQTLFLSIT